VNRSCFGGAKHGHFRHMRSADALLHTCYRAIAVRYWLTLCYLLASSEVLAQSGVSGGKPDPFELVWNAPSDCPDAASIRRSLARLLATGTRTSRRLRADARLEPARDTVFTLTLRTELGGMVGERILQGHTCAAVSDAAVLTLALMLNPDTELERDAPTQTAPKGAAPIGNLTLLPAKTFDLITPTKSAVPFGVQLSTDVGLAAGVLPQVGPELGLGVTALLGRASLLLNADYGPAQNSTLAERPKMGGRLWSAALGLIGCWTPRAQTFAVGPCVGSILTRLEGKGLGVLNPQGGVVYWFSPAVGGHFSARLHPSLSLRALAMGLMPVDRPMVYLDELGVIHRPPSIAGRVQIGVVVDLR